MFSVSPGLEAQANAQYKVQPNQFAQGLPPTQGAKDVVFAVLFYLNLVCMVGLAIFGIGQYVAANRTATGTTMSTLTTVTPASTRLNPLANTNLGADVTALGLVVLVCCGTGFLLAAFWMFLMMKYPLQLVIVTMVLKVLLWIALTVYFFFVGAIVGGIFGILGLCITLCCWWLWRHRIPFAAAILGTVAEVMKIFPGIIITAVVALVVLIAWAALWAFTTLSSSTWLNSNVGGYLLYIFFLFSFYWTAEVIRNTSHTTIAGTFATWYFQVQNMPRNPTVGAAKRALTTSFGSICFGSLIVAVIQTVRAILRSIARAQGQNAIVQIIVCFINCLLGCIESLIRYFNRYAYTQVAIYGKSFCEAAKDTWALVGTVGGAAIMNDSFIGPTLTIGALLGALVNFIVGALVGVAISGVAVTGMNADYTWLLFGLIGALIGYVIMSTAMSATDSCVATLFVAYAMEPLALGFHNKELQARFQAAEMAAMNGGVQVH